MAHESFEDEGVAELLNRYFISIKVDREERPDIDTIYMAVCQAFTGSGGWPLSVFLTPEQKPFFAGTYFPKIGRHGQIGFTALLATIADQWREGRATLLESADKIAAFVQKTESAGQARAAGTDQAEGLIERAMQWFSSRFDETYGGFGNAPKFPMAHQLLFLMDYHAATGDEKALTMAEKTLVQMYKGGLFDHIGYGFCRYSTDRRYLVPHFEKMLYDNGLLILAYSRAYAITGAAFYGRAARQVADYVLREMRGPEGGFYSAQDADSEGEEGKYYTFTYEEILKLLGEEDGRAFCKQYGISPLGNFEGKSIPNLLHDPKREDMDVLRQKVYEYRLGRYPLHLDDKFLTAWNGLMIAALANLSQTLGEERYLTAAREADRFLSQNMRIGDSLRVSFREGRSGAPGFLEDYAFYGLGLTALYDATLEDDFLERALRLARAAVRDFYDSENEGFFLAGKENEQLLFNPKPTYDGALPSGNSAMAHLLLALSRRTQAEDIQEFAAKQMAYMARAAQSQPVSYSYFLVALLSELYPPAKLVCVSTEPVDKAKIRAQVPIGTAVSILKGPEDGYSLLDGKTTFYACKGQTCLPPTNTLEGLL